MGRDCLSYSDTPRYHPSCAENRSTPLFGVVTAPPRPALHRNLIGTECPDHLVETISLAISICSLQAGCSRASSHGLGRRISTSADSLVSYDRGTTPHQSRHDSCVAGTLTYHATIGFDCVSNFACQNPRSFDYQPIKPSTFVVSLSNHERAALRQAQGERHLIIAGQNGAGKTTGSVPVWKDREIVYETEV